MKLYIYKIILALVLLNSMLICVRCSGAHGGSCVRGAHEEEEHEEEITGEEHDSEEHTDDVDDSYDLGLAIASVFVVGAVSFAGAAFPCLLAINRHPWIVNSVKFGSFAGSGVMLATGFVHMLFAADANLTSDCLPESWLSRYGPWAFLFATITIILMQTTDYILMSFIDSNLPIDQRVSGEPVDSDLENGDDCNVHITCKDSDCNSRKLITNGEVPKAKLLSNIVISEISIGMHSMIIGLALGMTSSDEFVALFVAIIFHQLLEGVALGSNASEGGLSSKLVLLLATVYSLTTPIGIAIGIGVRQSLDVNSPTFLYTTGILDAIAAGALIFLALGDHMNAVRTQAPWLRQQSVWVQLTCFGSFFTGAAVLLVLAIWA